MPELPHQSNGHQSVRPAFPDDIVVLVRMRPTTLTALRSGMDVAHLRLDAVRPGDDDLFDLYVETVQDIADTGAVPAWEAPHSDGFQATDHIELWDLLDD
jgi:hypothetical protein